MWNALRSHLRADLFLILFYVLICALNVYAMATATNHADAVDWTINATIWGVITGMRVAWLIVELVEEDWR